jgi:hypothetical protein
MKMKIPEFTAEASLYTTKKGYQSVSVNYNSGDQGVVAAMPVRTNCGPCISAGGLGPGGHSFAGVKYCQLCVPILDPKGHVSELCIPYKQDCFILSSGGFLG